MAETQPVRSHGLFVYLALTTSFSFPIKVLPFLCAGGTCGWLTWLQTSDCNSLLILNKSILLEKYLVVYLSLISILVAHRGTKDDSQWLQGWWANRWGAYNWAHCVCVYVCVCVCVLVTQLCPALCNPMDCSPPGSFVHGILQARILEWADISFSKKADKSV